MSRKNTDQYLHFGFDELPLRESGTNELILINGEESPFLTSGPIERAIKLGDGYFCSYPLGPRYNNIKINLSVGFWLYSNSIAERNVDGVNTPIKMPVFDITNAYVSGNTFSIPGGILLVYEKCVFDEYNQMIINLIDSSGIVHSFESEVYPTAVFNHFIISINMEINEIKMFINGVETILNSVSGTFPTYIGTNGSFDININKNIIGSINEFEKNSGIIDDLFVIDEYIIENYIIKKIITKGFKDSLNDITASFNEFRFEASLSFLQEVASQPTISAIEPFNSDVIGGTQDGFLIRGQNSFWNKVYNFASISSNEDISIKIIGIDGEPTEPSQYKYDLKDGTIIPGKGIYLNKNGIIISE